MQILIEQLITALAYHDWYYDRSDDYTVYAKYRDNWNLINSLCSQCEAVGMGTQARQMVKSAFENSTKHAH